MATQPINAGAVTLLDLAKSLDPDGKPAKVAELLDQNVSAIQDIPFMQGNLTTGNRSTVRTGLPEIFWRRAYKGIPPSKSTRAQVDDACGVMEARAEVDTLILRLYENPSSFRLSEAKAFIESMGQNFLKTMFYGDSSVSPDQFHGLTPRYNTRNAAVPISRNVLNAGGTGSDNMSIWLVCWGEDTVTGMYPKNTQGGLQQKDLGEYDATDPDGNRYRVVGDMYTWDVGLTVRDWRYAVRIANVDMSDLIAGTGTQALTASTNVLKMMIEAMALIPNGGKGRPVFYARREATTALAKMSLDKSAPGVLSIERATDQLGAVRPGFAGEGTLSFMGVPIRTVDQLLATESVVN